MHPVLIEIGPLTIYSYGFFVAAAFLAAISWSMREAKNRNMDPKLVSDIGFYIILGAIIGARLLYILINPVYFWNHPLDMLMFWKGGLVFSGGAIVGTLAGMWFLRSKKQSIWPWLDVFAPAVALGQGIGRFGCIAAGCCYGKSCSLPWAITFTDPSSLAPLNVALHPTQAYHSIAGWLTFAILLGLKNKIKGSGRLMGLFLILFAGFRFSIEFFRSDYRGDLGFLSVTQVISIGALLLGIWLFTRKTSNNNI